LAIYFIELIALSYKKNKVGQQFYGYPNYPRCREIEWGWVEWTMGDSALFPAAISRRLL
jgi:hypothetical protein